MSGPDDFYQADLSTLPLGVSAPAPEHSSWVPSFLRSAGRGAAPGAAGVAGFGAGAEAGAFAGGLGGPFAEITVPAGALIGGIAGSFGASAGTAKVQQLGADAVTGGAYTRSQARDEAEHPYASLLGSASTQLPFMRPSAGVAVLPRLIGAGVGGGLEAGQEYANTGTFDPGKIAIATGIGAALDTNTRLGDAAMGAGHALVSSIGRGAGVTLDRLGAKATVAAALRDVPDADATIHAAAINAQDPNISADTRADLARVRAMQDALGDRQTQDEVAAGHVIENDAGIEASNPHVATPETIAAHGDAMAAATQSLIDGTPVEVPDPRAAVRDWQMPEVRRDSWHWAVRQQESNGNPYEVSPKGARGAMQVMDATAADPGYGVTPARDGSLKERDRVGADLLDAYGKHYGNELLATAAYNAGPGRVDKWLRTIGDPRTGEISYADWAQRIPIKETRDYVRNVFQRMNAAPPTTPLLRPDLVAEGGPPSMPGIDGFDTTGQPWEDAVSRMRFTQEGGAAEALWHPDIGPIDVPWGEAGTGESDGFGLAKLDRFHPDIVDELPERVAAMNVVSQSPNRIRLESPDGQAAVSLNWQGDPAKPWLLTAYNREKAPAPAVDERAGAGGPDGSPGLEASADIAPPAGKNQKAPRPRRQSAPRQARGPTDLLTFIADHGGLSDDEGHDLQGRGKLISGAISGKRRRGGSAGIGLPAFAPGGGFLFRKGGLSLDQVGELLHEHGFVQGERPTTAEVLDMLASSNTKPIYRLEDQAEIERAAYEARHAPDPEDLGEAHPAELGTGAARDQEGVSSFDEPAGDAARVQTESLEHDLRMEVSPAQPGRPGGITPAEYLERFGTLTTARDFVDQSGGSNFMGSAVVDPDGKVFMFKTNSGKFGWRDEIGHYDFQDAVGPEEQIRYAEMTRYRGEFAITYPHEPSAAQRAALNEIKRRAKKSGANIVEEDPKPALTDAGRSEWEQYLADHDARFPASLDRGADVDPAIADRQRQEADLAAKAPLRASAEQDGTMGLGLFDAADQPQFRLDAEGGEHSLGEILDQADADANAASAIRGCLLPPKGDA